MRDMLLVVPSRGRPENIHRLLNALVETKTDCDFKVAVDYDDPKLDEYVKLKDIFLLDLEIGPRRKFARTVNDIIMSNVDNYKYFSWMGDDHLPKTLHWDARYRAALDKAGVGVVYGNDLVMGEAIATELAFTANIVKTLGYAIPPGFIHLYVDNYFMELGRSIDSLIYLSDVIVQHLHPCAGTAQEDQTYKEANSPENWTNDKIVFEEYRLNKLQIDAQKLREIL